MSIRNEYTLTKGQLHVLTEAGKSVTLAACGPMPLIYPVLCAQTPHDNLTIAWYQLGVEMGFKHLTVKPVEGGDKNRRFTAEPMEAD